MSRIYRESFIYRLFFQRPLIENGGETFLERSVVFRRYLLFFEKMRLFLFQSVGYRLIKRGHDFFVRYGFRIVGVLVLFSSFYFFLSRFIVEDSRFTLFEFFFYLDLFFLGFFFFIPLNHLPGYYERSWLKKYLFSKKLFAR